MVWLPPINTGERTLCADKNTNSSSFWTSVAHKDFADVYMHPAYQRTPRLPKVGSDPDSFTYDHSPRTKAAYWDWHRERPVIEKQRSRNADTKDFWSSHVTPNGLELLSKREKELDNLAALAKEEKELKKKIAAISRRNKETRNDKENEHNRKEYDYVQDYADPKDYDNYVRYTRRSEEDVVKSHPEPYPTNNVAQRSDRLSDSYHSSRDNNIDEQHYPSGDHDNGNRQTSTSDNYQLSEEEYRTVKQYQVRDRMGREQGQNVKGEYYHHNGELQETEGKNHNPNQRHVSSNHNATFERNRRNEAVGPLTERQNGSDEEYVHHTQLNNDRNRENDNMPRLLDATKMSHSDMNGDQSDEAEMSADNLYSYKRPRSDRYTSETMAKFKFNKMPGYEAMPSSRQAALGIVPANEFYEVEPIERLLPNYDREQTFKLATTYPALSYTRKKKKVPTATLR